MGLILWDSLLLLRNIPVFKDWVEIAVIVLAILGISASAVLAAFVQNSIHGVNNLYPWVMPVIVAFLVFGVLVLFRATYLQLALDVNKRSAEPVIEIVGVREQVLNQVGTGYAIEVYNRGLLDADHCHGRLVEIEFETLQEHQTLARWPIGRDLHWSGQVENVDSYTLPGHHNAILNVVYFDTIQNNWKVMLVYRSTPQYRMDINL